MHTSSPPHTPRISTRFYYNAATDFCHTRPKKVLHPPTPTPTPPPPLPPPPYVTAAAAEASRSTSTIRPYSQTSSTCSSPRRPPPPRRSRGRCALYPALPRSPLNCTASWCTTPAALSRTSSRTRAFSTSLCTFARSSSASPRPPVSRRSCAGSTSGTTRFPCRACDRSGYTARAPLSSLTWRARVLHSRA
ncbi:hypothetical protein BJV74DRAFT_862429 [Russula compacta]|nr:hypothetical protein BJV74DRAFT_862429 [Russula compacta]